MRKISSRKRERRSWQRRPRPTSETAEIKKIRPRGKNNRAGIWVSGAVQSECANVSRIDRKASKIVSSEKVCARSCIDLCAPIEKILPYPTIVKRGEGREVRGHWTLDSRIHRLIVRCKSPDQKIRDPRGISSARVFFSPSTFIL